MKISTDLRRKEETQASWTTAEREFFEGTTTPRSSGSEGCTPLYDLTEAEAKGFHAAIEYLVHIKKLEGVGAIADLVAGEYASQIIASRNSPLYTEELILKEGIVLAKYLLVSAATEYVRILQAG